MARDLKLEVLLQAIDKVTAPLRNITRGSSAMARQLKDSRDQLKQLQAQQKDVAGFRALKAASQQTTSALAAGEAKVRDLARALAGSTAPTKAMTAELNRAKRSAQALKQQHAEQQQQLQSLRNRLGEAGISTRTLSQHEVELRQRIVGTNSAIAQQEDRLKRATVQQQRMARAQETYRKTQQLAGNMAVGGAASMANGYAMAQPLMATVGAYAPAEDAATQLKVSMMDATGKVSADFAKVTALATQLGDRLPGTTAEFQSMMTMLLKQGISAKSVLGGTGEAAAYLGVQLKLPAEQAAEFAANMQDATGTAEADMMSLMDMIQKTANLGVNPNDIIQGFSKMSPAMTLLGEKGLKTSQAMAPLLAMMTQTGMAGESAGNALRKVLQSGLDLTKVGKANKEIKQLGISLDFTNGKGEFGGLDHLFAQLDKLKKLTSVQRTSVLSTIFGDDAETLQVVQTMMDKGMAGYREVAGKMAAQADLRMRVNEQLKTLTNVMDAAAGSWTNAKAEFGAAVAPELKGLIQSLGEMANRVGAWARANPQLAGTLVKVTAGIGALAIAFGTVTISLAGVLGPLAMVKLSMATLGIKSLPLLGLLPKLGAAVRGVSIALWGLAANPVVLAITAIAAAIGVAAYLIWNNWGTLGPKFTALWDGIKATFGATMDWFAGLPARFVQFGGDILRGLASGITGALGSVKDAVVGAGESAIGWFKEKLGIHSPSRVFAELGGYTMAGLEQGIQTGQKNPFAALDQTAQGVVQKGKEISAANPFAALDSVAKAAPKAASAGNPFAALGRQPPAVDNRPALAAARPATAPAAGGNTYNITVHATPGMDPEAIGRAVAAELDRRERSQQARTRSALYDRE